MKFVFCQLKLCFLIFTIAIYACGNAKDRQLPEKYFAVIDKSIPPGVYNADARKVIHWMHENDYGLHQSDYGIANKSRVVFLDIAHNIENKLYRRKFHITHNKKRIMTVHRSNHPDYFTSAKNDTISIEANKDNIVIRVKNVGKAEIPIIGLDAIADFQSELGVKERVVARELIKGETWKTVGVFPSDTISKSTEKVYRILKSEDNGRYFVADAENQPLSEMFYVGQFTEYQPISKEDLQKFPHLAEADDVGRKFDYHILDIPLSEYKNIQVTDYISAGDATVHAEHSLIVIKVKGVGESAFRIGRNIHNAKLFKLKSKNDNSGDN